MTIGETRFKIDETLKIEPVNGNENNEYMIIPPGLMGVKIVGFDKGYKINMDVIRKGRVLFFLSSRSDCEKLVGYCAKTYGLSRQYAAIHAGATIDLSAIREDAWLFCTDIVGQSITIPGCKVVVDFLEEIKSSTRLYYNKLGLVYTSELKRRRIDEFTSRQRKGRTGRTNAGWYVTPMGQSPVARNGIDVRNIGEAILRLRSIGVYSRLMIKDYYLEEVLKDIAAIEWILPENLIEVHCWNHAMNKLNSQEEPGLSMNLADKLKLVTGVNGDLLYLYLTPIISKELIEKTMSDREWSRTGATASDREFYKVYSTHVRIVDTEIDRENHCAELRLAISCDRERMNLPVDISLELRTMLETDRRGATCSGDYEEVEDSAACTIMVLTAATCTVLSGVYWWMEHRCERTVTRVAAIGSDHVVPVCKYYASVCKTTDEYTSDKRKALTIIKSNLDSAIHWLQSIGVKREKMDSETLIQILSDKIVYGFSLVPSAWHVGLVPSLTTIFGSVLVGTWYVSLEEVLGSVLAVAFLITLNTTVAVMTPLPMAITCIVGEIFAFIISAIANRRSVLYDRYGRSLSYPGKAWRLVFSGIGGIALGKMIIPSLVVSKPATVAAGTSTIASPIGANLGRSGLAINIVKQIYVILVRIQQRQVGIETLGPILTSAFSAMALDVTTIVIGVVTAIALIAIRKALEYAKYTVGTIKPRFIIKKEQYNYND